MYQNILECITYYGVQGKALTESEILRYLTTQTTGAHLRSSLDRLLDELKVVREGDGYVLVKHKEVLTNSVKREAETKKKLEHIAHFLWLLKLIPWINYVGLTGSCGISNAVAADDIDLMIITAPRRLFITRLLAVVLASVMRVRRRRSAIQDPNKVCMNLWLDASDLSVPTLKRSLYTARESAQMQPLFDKDATVYKRFLDENSWIADFLPNFYVKSAIKSLHSPNPIYSPHFLLDKIELIVKKVQLHRIKLHQTTELISDTQLWFHPLDRSHLS